MLRPYQENTVEQIKNFLRYREGNGLCVAPVGSGKSHIIVAIAEWLADQDERVLILADRQELLEQTGDKFSNKSKIGYVSGGLNSYDYDAQIVLGSIQTLYNKTHYLGEFKYILIDEANAVENNPESNSMYWQLIKEYPDARIIGFTATPFRTKDGTLSWGAVCAEIEYEPLFNKGYLCKLTNKVCDEPDLSQIKVVAGEYVQKGLERLMIKQLEFSKAITRIVAYGEKRNFWLIFCSSVGHAQIVQYALGACDIDAEILTGKTPKKQRQDIIERGRRGEYKALVNVEIATIGLDIPCIDMIACLRPTKSRALWEQMIGRGVRLHDSKEDCLLLDFAGNLREHGGLGMPTWKYVKGKKVPIPTNKGRICPECEDYVRVIDKICEDCGYEFPKEQQRSHNHYGEFDKDSEILKKKDHWYTVSSVEYEDYTAKKSGNRMLRVTYYCGYSKFHQYQYSKNRLIGWLKRAHPEATSYEIEDVVKLTPANVSKIKVREVGKYPEILEVVYTEEVA